MHTENQLPMLPGSALKVPVWWGGVGGVVASYPLLSQAPTPVDVEFGCDNKDQVFYFFQHLVSLFLNAELKTLLLLELAAKWTV